MSDRRSDRELVAKVQGGDRRAFDLLVIKYQHKVASLISRYIRDPGEVMDIAQEVFLKAYRVLPGFRGESTFYTWLYRIAVNTVKNHLVAQGRRPPGDDVEANLAEQMETGGCLRELATPEHYLLSVEIAETVQAALDELPEELRMAILLRELEGLSYEEIANGDGMPRGHRAFAHLSRPRGDRQTLTTLARAMRKAMSEQQRRHLSVLADGEIDPGSVHPTLSALASNERLVAAWEGYHLSAPPCGRSRFTLSTA